MPRFPRPFFALTTFTLAGMIALPACKPAGGGKKGRSELSMWVDQPTPGTTSGNKISIAPLGLTFEVPDTLYVLRTCSEASHTPQGSQKWVPVVTCKTASAADVDSETFGSAGQSVGVPIEMTIFATHKTRPIDERAVSWFENQFKQGGLDVEEISYQADYQKKGGIYAKLYVLDEGSGNPVKEIVQFLFARRDVVFIARVEYPFGDTRAIEQDWSFILWNFDFPEPEEEEA